MSKNEYLVQLNLKKCNDKENVNNFKTNGNNDLFLKLTIRQLKSPITIIQSIHNLIKINLSVPSLSNKDNANDNKVKVMREKNDNSTHNQNLMEDDTKGMSVLTENFTKNGCAFTG